MTHAAEGILLIKYKNKKKNNNNKHTYSTAMLIHLNTI
jgi:hypothetical protein